MALQQELAVSTRGGVEATCRRFVAVRRKRHPSYHGFQFCPGRWRPGDSDRHRGDGHEPTATAASPRHPAHWRHQ